MTSGAHRNLTAALEYAKLGWSVFPVHSVNSQGRCTCGRKTCSSAGKHPLTEHGLKDASTDPKRIRDWWGASPWANVAIVMGEPSGGLSGLDVDPRHRGDSTLADLINQHEDLPTTTTASTGGGGKHHLFTPRNGETIPTRKLGPGLDLRGEGAYLVAPFSRHTSGQTYRWDLGLSPLKTPPAPIPDWLLEEEAGFPMEPGNGEPVPVPDVYPAGERNDRLFRDACALRRRGLDEAAIFAALQVHNLKKCDPPLGEAELRMIARNVTGRYEPAALAPGEVAAIERPDPLRITAPVTPLDLADILSRPYEPPKWLIPEWICDGPECTILAGEWGSAKSVVALHLALNLARERRRTFLDYLPLSGSQMSVLYVDQENPIGVVEQRVRRIATALKITPEEQKAMPLGYLHKEGLNPDTQVGKDRLMKAIERFEPRFLILDSLARHHVREENSNSEMAQYYNEILDPLKERYRLGILVLQNMTKGRFDNGRRKSLEERVRGASAIMDSADNGWAMDKQSITERTINLIKNRYGTNPRGLNVILEDSEDDTELHVRAINLPSQADDQIWEVLTDQKHAGVLRSALVKHLEEVEQIAHATADKNVTRVLKRLSKQDKIRRRKEGREMRIWLSMYSPEDSS